MSEIDLTPFYDPDEIRENIRAPFSDAEHTYATDGCIMVRVPRRMEIAKSKFSVRAVKVFANPMPRKFFPIPRFNLKPKVACSWCKGLGKLSDDEDGECPLCDGKKKVYILQPIKIINACFDAHYLAMIRALPGSKIAPNRRKQAHFIFDGGDGILMPLIL